MPSLAIEILVIVVLIVLNGVFAMSELAVVSSRKIRLQQWANEGRAPARVALELAEAPNTFLSTVQVGITLIGILAGAFGGQNVSRALADQIRQIEPLAPYSSVLGLAIVVALITYGTLVIGELVPKRLALQNPERIATLVAPPMRALSRLAYPVVQLLTLSTGAVLRLLGVQPSTDQPVTEEEIRMMMEQGTEAGVFEMDEQEMVESVFRLDDRQVRSLMTPHTELTWLDLHDSPEQVRQKLAASPHSAFPVCRGGLDNVLGTVRAAALLNQVLAGEPLNLEADLRPAHFVPENATASDALDLFRSTEEPIALVIDEHGSIQGIVTEHDMLEAIVGTLPSAQDDDMPQVVEREDGSWLVDGLLYITPLKELLGVQQLPEESRGGYQTLGGMMMDRLDTIPQVGQGFTWDAYTFEVVDMDGLRVDKVLITRRPTEEVAPPEETPPED